MVSRPNSIIKKVILVLISGSKRGLPIKVTFRNKIIESIPKFNFRLG